MIPEKISCALLAGGKATRFNGANKALIKIGNRTNFERFLDVTDSIFNETIVVSDNSDHYSDYEKVIVAGDFCKNVGPVGGIHAALKISNCPAVFLFSCDMPFLNKDLILRQIDKFNSLNCSILIPRIGDFIEPLHAVYSKSIVEKLEQHLKTCDNYSIRHFFKETDVFFWDIENNAENRKAFTNINTSHDYLKAVSGMEL